MKYQVTIKNPTGETKLDAMTNLLFVGYSTENGNPILIVGDGFEDSDIATMLYSVKHCYKDLYKKQNRIVKNGALGIIFGKILRTNFSESRRITNNGPVFQKSEF